VYVLDVKLPVTPVPGVAVILHRLVTFVRPSRIDTVVTAELKFVVRPSVLEGTVTESLLKSIIIVELVNAAEPCVPAASDGCSAEKNGFVIFLVPYV
jgi:hypothetical protein